MGVKYYIFLVYVCLLFFNKKIEAQNMIINTSKQLESIDSIRVNAFFTNPDKYNIDLLLPFCVEKNDSILNINIDSIIEIEQDVNQLKFYKKTQISIDFLHGFLMSLDSFSNLEIKVSLYDIFDGKDSSKTIINDIIDSKKLSNSDLIIGPLFSDNFFYFINIIILRW